MLSRLAGFAITQRSAIRTNARFRKGPNEGMRRACSRRRRAGVGVEGVDGSSLINFTSKPRCCPQGEKERARDSCRLQALSAQLAQSSKHRQVQVHDLLTSSRASTIEYHVHHNLSSNRVPNSKIKTLKFSPCHRTLAYECRSSFT